jgi:hypothetical protein
MKRRGVVVLVVIVTAVVAVLAAAYLTGFIIILGDPFSGVWNTDPAATLSPAGTWIADGPNASSGVVIKRTSSGYVYTMVAGTTTNGWHPLERDGRVLDSKASGATFEYQPWSGHLVFTDQPPHTRRLGPLVLKKVTDSTSIPPQTK